MTPSLAGWVSRRTHRRGGHRHIVTDPGFYAKVAKYVKMKWRQTPRRGVRINAASKLTNIIAPPILAQSANRAVLGDGFSVGGST